MRPRNGPPEAVSDEPLDGARRPPRDQLVQRRVLGVDRQHPRAGRLGELHHELAADDERLLVREREVDALAERRDGRAEPGGADERVQHEVGARLGDQPHEPLRPGEHLAVRQASSARAAASASASAIRANAVRRGLRDERLPGALAASPTTSSSSGARDDVERLHADRAGRAEDEERAAASGAPIRAERPPCGLRTWPSPTRSSHASHAAGDDARGRPPAPMPLVVANHTLRGVWALVGAAPIATLR